ncbi:hypothetical protein C8T65DRAFT_658959 [Cerioporus squamosus]|nr:hypothetical protein C8T65DRAFT_658959 [Cerioporus squamosus]
MPTSKPQLQDETRLLRANILCASQVSNPTYNAASYARNHDICRSMFPRYSRHSPSALCLLQASSCYLGLSFSQIWRPEDRAAAWQLPPVTLLVAAVADFLSA